MLIIWDYFGVVADDVFWYQAQKIAVQKGYGPDLAAASNAVNKGTMSWEQFCREVSEDIGLSLDEVRERYDQHNINKDAVLAIKKYKKHAKHVLLSNAAHTHLLPLMTRLGLNTLFDEIFVSSLIGYAKPDPRCFKHVLRAMDSEAGDSLLIDDMAANSESADNLGIRTITYSSEINLQEKLASLIQQ